jgi:hypothetical protein
VAAEYRFTTAVSGGTFTLGETTAVKTGDNPFSLTGVYTEGGGTWTADTGSGTWVYLYDATGKRGIVMKYTSGSEIGLIRVKLGAATVETLRPDYTFTPALSTDGMSANPAATFYNE